MSVRRKRYRVEEIISPTTTPAEIESDVGSPMHREIMLELREIRKHMTTAPSSTAHTDGHAAADDQIEQARALLDSYRAQIEQCEKLKIELDIIHEAISRTKQEIATLHSKGVEGGQMAVANGELGAIVGGTEQATQQILSAAESIDNAAATLKKLADGEPSRMLTDEIQENVIAIFEACNFQDLTGQRISKVMATMKFIETHLSVMLDIWGGLDEIKSHARPDDRDEDAKLLNGPRPEDETEGHVSQDDIDALFN